MNWFCWHTCFSATLSAHRFHLFWAITSVHKILLLDCQCQFAIPGRTRTVLINNVTTWHWSLPPAWSIQAVHVLLLSPGLHGVWYYSLTFKLCRISQSRLFFMRWESIPLNLHSSPQTCCHFGDYLPLTGRLFALQPSANHWSCLEQGWKTLRRCLLPLWMSLVNAGYWQDHLSYVLKRIDLSFIVWHERLTGSILNTCFTSATRYLPPQFFFLLSALPCGCTYRAPN